MNQGIDVRDVLPVLRTPTLVIHVDQDSVIDVAHGRALARAIADARYVELHGVDHVPFHEPLATATLEALEAWLASRAGYVPAERRLATVLATAPAPVRPPAEVARMHQLVVAHRGRPASTADGDPVVVFDGPALAVRCATALAEAARRAGEPFRAGLDCGELEIRPLADATDDAPAAMALEVHGRAAARARAIECAAAPGEVWITRALHELLAGSGIGMAARGALRLGDDETEPRPVFAAGVDQAAAAGA
jgi:hypothetical protein